MTTKAEKVRRPVALHLTFIQAAHLRAVLDAYILESHPSRRRASIALTRDYLRRAHREAVKP